MKIPNPYFKNIPGYGNLSVEEIFFEDYYLILFVLISEKGQRLLAYCCDVREEQRWILSPVSNQDVIDFVHNRIPIYDLLTKAYDHIVVVRDYATCKETFKFVSTIDLDELDLPAKEEFLDVDPDDYKDYIQKLRNITCISLISYRRSILTLASYHAKTNLNNENISQNFKSQNGGEHLYGYHCTLKNARL